MHPFSIYAGIVVTQRLRELEHIAREDRLARSIRASRPSRWSRITMAAARFVGGARLAVDESEPIVPKLVGYPTSWPP